MSATDGPVVVGALGGSGTRLVAAMLAEAGIFIGRDLNREQDNLWFTLLFKRPRWYARTVARDPAAATPGLRLLERAMATGAPRDAGQSRFLRRALFEALTGAHAQGRAHTPGWPLRQALGLWRAAPAGRAPAGRWGFKEPNAHVYLRPLAAHFPGLRFVYVMRHGLDMAFSGNRQQLENWGPLFGVSAAPDGMNVPQAMLAWWIAASERAIADGHELLGPRFLVLSYDALCLDPQAEAARLLAFLGHPADAATLARLAALADPPATIGRYRQHDLGQFDQRALDTVRALGFPLQ